MEPTISLCLMAKNEADVIGRAIESARDIADEIILVDTGSTDATNSIARGLGAQVFLHPWENHFSRSRNHMLSHASADWVLYIDADEEVHPVDRGPLRELVRAAPPDVLGFNLLKQDLDIDEHTFSHQHYTIRLFRRIPGIHFVGRVHNQLVIDMARCRNTRLRLLHHVYNKRQQRNERSIKLLELSLRETPGAHDLKLNLGGLYCQEGRHEEGISILKDACENIATPALRAKACYITAVNLVQSGLHEEAERYLRRSLDVVPCFLSARFALADLYATRLNNLAQAIAEMEQIVNQTAEPPDEFWDMGTNPGLQSISAPWNLAVYYRAAGRLPEAEPLLLRVLEHRGNHETQVRADLADILTAQGKYDRAAEELQIVKTQEPGFPNIGLKHSAVLEQAGALEEALAVAECHLEDAPDDHALNTARGRLLLKQGKLGPAETALRKAVGNSPPSYEASSLLLADCLRRRAEEERNPLLLKESVALVKAVLSVNPASAPALAILRRIRETSTGFTPPR